MTTAAPTYTEELIALSAIPCDEYCPSGGHCCGLPEWGDIKHGLEKGIVWMCHSNEKIPCTATRVVAIQNGIKLNLKTQTPVTDADEFFKLLDSTENL